MVIWIKQWKDDKKLSALFTYFPPYPLKEVELAQKLILTTILELSKAKVSLDLKSFIDWMSSFSIKCLQLAFYLLHIFILSADTMLTKFLPLPSIRCQLIYEWPRLTHSWAQWGSWWLKIKSEGRGKIIKTLTFCKSLKKIKRVNQL